MPDLPAHPPARKAKPAILAVDDDPAVLNAVRRDLNAKYGRDFRVLGVDSGASALETLAEARRREDPVALLLVDQRMPEMTGVEFLEKAIGLFPDARKVLLTAYADTEAAIHAINRVHLDHYILKPWDPPEDRLYPVLDDLLEEWLSTYRPRFQGIRVIRDRWSAASHDLELFLGRNQVPYKAFDIESEVEASDLLSLAGLTGAPLPVVLLEDGSALVRPTSMELAKALNLRIEAERPFYDLVIVGGGPAGLAAAVYGASEGLKTLLVEEDAYGGQAGQSARIENYLGFPRGLSGAELARRAVAQATRFKAELLLPVEATGLRCNDPYRIISLSNGATINCRAVLVATGVSYRRLDVPDADRLTGAGVYYGASSLEAKTHRDGRLIIVGGGNSAGQAAVYLAGFASKVTMVVRAPLEDTMSQYLIDQIGASGNIEVRTGAGITRVVGSDRLEAVGVEYLREGTGETVPADGLFIFIGQAPRTEWLGDLLMRDPQGFILSGVDCGTRPRGWAPDRVPFALESSVPGVFVAGDVRYGSTKRIASATGEGAMAVRFVHEYLASR